MKKEKKRMWHSPWAYRESLFIVTALVVGGFGIQLISGPFDFYLLHKPANYFVLAIIIILSLFGLSVEENRAVKWLSSIPLVVSLITFLLIFSLIMGLTPQLLRLPQSDDLLLKLGFAQVTSSWPFVIIYLMTLLSLGLTISKRIKKSRKGKVLFLLNHLGLWLVLAAAGLGAADMKRHVMYVQKDQVEWRVYSDEQQVLELPLAIRLDDFIMEEYPAKLLVVDRRTGTALPQGHPDLYQIDLKSPKGQLLDWDITLTDYLYQGVPAGGGVYNYSNMPASVQAAHIVTKNRHSKDINQGWVSSGNNFIPPSPLMLDDNHVLVMGPAEPKKFASNVKVYAQNGQEKEAVIEVNKPLRVNEWLIYQYGYDNQAGRMSSYSSFELVYDPWLYMVYAGLFLWMLGSLGLIYQGKPRRGKK